MPIESLHQLRLFLCVAKEQSFSKAADSLHISQPSVSIQIHRLEDSLGVTLFQRLGRAVHLTPEGELLAEYTERIFDSITDCETEISKFRGLSRGRITVGGNTVPTVGILPVAIAGFKKDHPDTEILLKVSRRDQVERWILDNELDLALILGDPLSAQIRREHFCDEERVLVLPSKHPLAKKRRVLPSEIADQHLLLPESGDLKFRIGRIFSEKRVRVQQTTFGNIEAIISAINCGLGMSILSKSIVERHAANKAIAMRSIRRVNLKSPVNIIFHKDKHLSQLAIAFLDHLRGLAKLKLIAAPIVQEPSP